VVVNNAGVGYFAPLEDLTVGQFDEIMAVNVRGMFLVTRAFLPGMRKTGGAIVNIASLAGKNGFVGGTAYTASKHAVLGFSKSLMLEVRKDNVRVIAVCPGSVATPFFAKAGQDLPNRDRVLTPEDVAAAVIDALKLADRAMISELDIRPTNP
jgi:3-oxoacyl-[acyl-carrier protein] reductase